MRETLKMSLYGDMSPKLIDACIKKNNIMAMKILFFLSRTDISKTEKIHDMQFMEFDEKELLSYCNISKPSLRENLKTLVETSVKQYTSKRSFSYSSLIPEIEFNNGRIKIRVFTRIWKLISRDSKQYINIDLKSLMQLKSKHSIRMVALLSKINQYDEHIPKRTTMNIEELNDFFGTNYIRFTDIEKKVIIKIKKELDEKSDLKFIYQANTEQNQTSTGRPKIISATFDLIK